MPQRQHRQLHRAMQCGRKSREDRNSSGCTMSSASCRTTAATVPPFRRLVAQQRAPQRVEAIGLGGRPGRRPDHQPHPRIRLQQPSPPRRSSRDRSDRSRHRAHNRDDRTARARCAASWPITFDSSHAAMNTTIRPGGIRPIDPAKGEGPRRAQPQSSCRLAGSIDQVDQQIVDAADQEEDRREQRRLARNSRRSR
jgi:hypothetical protein